MAAAEVKKQIYEMRDLPTLPIVAQKLMSATDGGDESFGAISKIIEQDQSLTVKILGLANAAFYGQTSQVSSVSRAVSVIGTEMLKRLALCAFVKRSWGFDATRQHFWKHSIAIAFGTAFLAKESGVPELSPDDAFCAGLLHDAGVLVLESVCPEEYAKVEQMLENPLGATRQEVERELIGVDHAEAGSWLAERWKLPPLLMESIAEHHSGATEIARLIQQTEYAAMNVELGLVGEPDPPTDETSPVQEFLHAKGEEIDTFFALA